MHFPQTSDEKKNLMLKKIQFGDAVQEENNSTLLCHQSSQKNLRKNVNKFTHGVMVQGCNVISTDM